MPAHEARHEGVGRAVEDGARRARLGDPAVVHHDDEVGQRQRLVLAVGDVDEGEAEVGLQPLQLLPHLDPQEGIERRQRLVQQQDLGVR